MAQNTFSVEFLNTCEIVTATLGNEHLLDKVEEILYIRQELTPCKNRCSWAFPFLRGEPVRFTYHKCEYVWVWSPKPDKVYVADNLKQYHETFQ